MTKRNALVREYKMTGDCDAWGSAMNAWFAVAHELYARHANIPAHWEFKPGCTTTAENARDDGNYWFEVFQDYGTDDLIRFGNILERYARLIRRAGKDY